MAIQLTVACDLGRNQITCLITTLLIQFGPYLLVYKQELTAQVCASKLGHALAIFCLLSTFNMSVMQIVHQRARLRHLMQENKNLLDKMHEGIIIVSETDRSFQFASKPASKMIQSTVEEN